MQSSQSSRRTIGELAGVLSIGEDAVEGAFDEAHKHVDANLASKKEIVDLQSHLLKTLADQKMLFKNNEATRDAIASCNHDLNELVDALKAKVEAQRMEANRLREQITLAKQGGGS